MSKPTPRTYQWDDSISSKSKPATAHSEEGDEPRQPTPARQQTQPTQQHEMRDSPTGSVASGPAQREDDDEPRQTESILSAEDMPLSSLRPVTVVNLLPLGIPAPPTDRIHTFLDEVANDFSNMAALDDESVHSECGELAEDDQDADVPLPPATPAPPFPAKKENQDAGHAANLALLKSLCPAKYQLALTAANLQEVVSESDLSSSEGSSAVSHLESKDFISVDSDVASVLPLDAAFAPKKDAACYDRAGPINAVATAEQVATTLTSTRAGAFHNCTGGCGQVLQKGGVPTFNCVKADPLLKKKGGYVSALSKVPDEVLEVWMKCHGLCWGSYSMVEKCCTNHRKSPEGKLPMCKVVTLNGVEVFRCSCRGCQRTYPPMGPFVDNYKKLPLSAKLAIMFRWAESSSACVEGANSSTVRKHTRRLEAALATWMVQHTLRLKALANRARALKDPSKELDHVEVDETFFSKPKYGRGKMRRSTFILETMVVVDKGGRTVDFACTPIFKKSWYHLRMLIHNNLPPWSLPIFSDSWSGYTKVKDTHVHRSVNHSKEFVTKDGVSTNNVEAFHGVIKRCLKKKGGYINARNHPRAFRILAACGHALSKPKAAEYEGNTFVWMFQALASVVMSGHFMMDDPEADRTTYYRRLIAAAKKQALFDEERAHQIAADDAATTSRRGPGRPKGSKNTKPTAADLAAAAAIEAVEASTGKKLSKKAAAAAAAKISEEERAGELLVELISRRDACRRYFSQENQRLESVRFDARHTPEGEDGTPSRGTPSRAARRYVAELIANMNSLFATKIQARNAYRSVITELMNFRYRNAAFVARYELSRPGNTMITDQEVLDNGCSGFVVYGERNGEEEADDEEEADADADDEEEEREKKSKKDKKEKKSKKDKADKKEKKEKKRAREAEDNGDDDYYDL